MKEKNYPVPCYLCPKEIWSKGNIFGGIFYTDGPGYSSKHRDTCSSGIFIDAEQSKYIKVSKSHRKDKYTIPMFDNDSLNDNDIFFDYKLPEEIIKPELYVEGAIENININRFERDRKARTKCIEHYGYNCYICSFNFFERYGNIGKDFIHVHHIKPLSEISQEYNVNPINDMIPVCPNCHAIIHRKTPHLSIEEAKNIIEIYKT